MSYQHVLVTVDLSEASKTLIDKAIEQAQPANSKLSIVYVETDHLRSYPDDEARLEAQLQTLADDCGYPVNEIITVIGDLHMKVAGLVENSDIDLVVCGHHHNLVSRFFSAVPKLVNTVKADLLVVNLG
ncbi:universal stress protein [Marinobacterium iners]|uniref:Universal stress protein A n=1 Tax=Marinobacterium iners DSM 11526 TaxID=1122198 RepID=A0A1H4GFC8_9GAMM|nr:universal stress protein [Marinobacterium iners]SEB08325.1 universal stress protein A [Marinobacterium iners DSM 11526]